MDMAHNLGRVDGGQEKALEVSCRTAQAELAGWLRSKMRSGGCEDALILTCAWLALAGLTAGKIGGGRFTIGEATIQEGDGATRAATLRLQAGTVLGPRLASWGFAF